MNKREKYGYQAISFDVAPELKKILVEAAKKQERSLSGLLRKYIRMGLKTDGIIE
jgi:predicted HicB family RNase H-like nuclease